MIKSKSCANAIRISMVLTMLMPALVFSQDSQIGELRGDAGRGARVYTRYCVSCHGTEGNGEGESARSLDPKPRDFTAGTFKCRSTPTGSLPLDSDLFDTIGRGLHASAMPSWYPLTRLERADLVGYIKTFSSRFKEEKPQAPLVVPPETSASGDSLTRGKELFRKMECFKCHGEDGRGNGPAAISLTDSKNRPIVPYDFTSGERFKCGETNEDLYRIFMTGLDGTPMPSFSDQLKPEEAWDLVHYLRTLQHKQVKNPILTTLFHGRGSKGSPSKSGKEQTATPQSAGVNSKN